MKKIIILLVILMQYSFAFADEYSEYNKDISGEAKAKATNMYGAWAGNMAYHIERNIKDGSVVNGPTNNKHYAVDGFGNVVIKDGARITAPVIVKEDFSNATMVGKQSRY